MFLNKGLFGGDVRQDVQRDSRGVFTCKLVAAFPGEEKQVEATGEGTKVVSIFFEILWKALKLMISSGLLRVLLFYIFWQSFMN